MRDPSPRKKRSDCENSITATDLSNIIRKSLGESEQKSKVPDQLKTTRNRILGNIVSVRAPLNLPPLMTHHKNLRPQ